jgi:hypothetical protein
MKVAEGSSMDEAQARNPWRFEFESLFEISFLRYAALQTRNGRRFHPIDSNSQRNMNMHEYL